MIVLRLASTALGPRWWRVTECRMDNGAPEPPPIAHWAGVLGRRMLVAQRLGVPNERDQDLYAVLMLFAESMHKLLRAREGLLKQLVTMLSALGDAPLSDPSAASGAVASASAGASGAATAAGAAGAAAAASASADLDEATSSATAMAVSAGGGAAGDDDAGATGDLSAEMQEALAALDANIRQQSSLLAALHGASGMLSLRSPMMSAYSFLLCYPYIPDLVRLAQIGGQVYLPPIFAESGIGLSAADVDRGRALLLRDWGPGVGVEHAAAAAAAGGGGAGAAAAAAAAAAASPAAATRDD